jgi:hypothetical protein
MANVMTTGKKNVEICMSFKHSLKKTLFGVAQVARKIGY